MARVYHEIGLFLRSIGLGIVVTAFAALRKDFVEPTKVAIRCSRVTALLRSLLHVIPLAVAITEIVLNYRGYYYGGYFSLQPYYQLAAKAHEITMQASLALIVLSFIRHHVAFSGGLPFGTFLGGLQFLQPSYLWSSELWASVAMKDSPRRKFIPLAFLIACGILAVTLGPASATLLIPRLIQWPLQPTQFSVNGSFQEIWPDLIEASNIPYDCTTLLTTDSKSLCPAGGWQDLIAAFNNSPDEYFVNNPEPGIGNIDIRDPKLSFSSTTAAQICQSSLKDQVCGSSIQAVVAEGAWSSIIEFTNAFDNQKSSQDAIHILSNDYYEPYVLASCGSQSVSRSNGNESLQFPLISESELDQGQVIVAVTNTTISQILDVTGNASEYRLQWIDLPYSDFGRALGAILLHPTDNETDSSINITNCAVGAGWGASAMGMSDEWGYILFSNIRGVPGSWHTREAPILNSIVQSVPDYGNHSGSIFPQRRMTIEPSFAELVNPTIVVNHDYNTSLVHLILSSDLAVEKGIEIDRVLVTMLTTGLARMGINLDWQGALHTPNQLPAYPNTDAAQRRLTARHYARTARISKSTTL